MLFIVKIGSPSFTSRSSLRLMGLCALTSLSLSLAANAQSVIYCETFGNNQDVDVSLSEINTDWRGYRGRDAKDITDDSQSASSKVVSSNPGFPRNVPNEGTPEPSLSESKGFVFQNFDPGLFVTTSFEIDPSKYSKLTFSWHAANSSEEDGFRLAVRVGDAWYATDQLFTTPSTNIAGFEQNPQDFDYTTQALKWRHLDFAPGEMLAVGEVCTMDLPREKITGFGLLFEGQNSNKRFDTFTILGTPR